VPFRSENLPVRSCTECHVQNFHLVLNNLFLNKVCLFFLKKENLNLVQSSLTGYTSSLPVPLFFLFNFFSCAVAGSLTCILINYCFVVFLLISTSFNL
jgi:hypothetical protein